MIGDGDGGDAGSRELKKIKVLRIIARLNIGGPAIHTVLLTAGLDTGMLFWLVLGIGSAAITY